MGYNGESDKKRLGYGRLVKLAGHKQERFGIRDRLVYQREYRGISDMEAGKEGEGIGRVALDSG